ncbi:MAG: polysaccharide deacetylase family protein [Rhodospirillales bacterium]|nr:polysaccharide deacetylase family protein [Rhodospirillales bacterium]MBT4038503.1 polysaccharide deacetylase family protein [Rhodospirillales bacterium]MBT4625415.1 polysaccharide deacetylase family protein [Rhodospirillales bacterium]MBT5352053.1 polysaccharide deacetylase family protein [Rhodospirillales bacterium]MBT5521822.1 polysaccharide deacetylase family protein [Rhodospirillales bacterium]
MIVRLLAMLAALFPILLGSPAHAQSESVQSDSAVVIMYHRFGDDRYPSTNIRLEQFEAHVQELLSGGYTVLPIPEIIRRQQGGESLPDRTVGLSIDDAYLSVYAEAWPRLRDAGLPFTLFVSTGGVDQGLADIMSWDQIREMVDGGGVTIGAHTRTHLHMPDFGPTRLSKELAESNARYKAELGITPTVFAYPYGEASSDVVSLVKEHGYTAAFGQHSGAFDSQDFAYYLPRFPLNEKFGDMGRFKTAVNALAMSVTDITPENMSIPASAPAPAMGFTLRKALPRSNLLSCFLSHEGKAEIIRLGDTRIEVRVETPFPAGRVRLNCTLPGSGKNAGRWHWFGQQYYQLKGE